MFEPDDVQGLEPLCADQKFGPPPLDVSTCPLCPERPFAYIAFVAFIVPVTSKLYEGDVVPIPTLPLLL